MNSTSAMCVKFKSKSVLHMVEYDIYSGRRECTTAPQRNPITLEGEIGNKRGKYIYNLKQYEQ